VAQNTNKMKSTQGSSGMYADHDNVIEAPKKYVLRIANSRGKKPLLRDIKKARDILQNVLIELNSCAGRTAISDYSDVLWDILEDNK
jgi:hypothetical protein